MSESLHKSICVFKRSRKKECVKKSIYFKEKSNLLSFNSFTNKHGTSGDGGLVFQSRFYTSSGLDKFTRLKYQPPQSPFKLIQEQLFHDPWKLLVATIFLNRTNAHNAIPTLWRFFECFPSPEKTVKATAKEIEDILQPLGLHRKRSYILQRFSLEYLTKNWQYPDELYGIGKYGCDSFKIFCVGEYQEVLPDDTKLNLYHTWLCERERQNEVEKR